MSSSKIAMVAITLHGTKLLTSLAKDYPDADIYMVDKFSGCLSDFPDSNQPIFINIPIRELIESLFEQYDLIVLVFAIGAAVRLISPWLKSKHEDPGVVVIDDSAKYVIPILSGHIGGANAFAIEIAEKISAQVILTTASESRCTIAVDILGKELGWKIDSPEINQLNVAAQVVNDEPIAFILEQEVETGFKPWWPDNKKLPDNIHLFKDFNEVDRTKFSAFLWLTHRQIAAEILHTMGQYLVVYRPPEYIVLGLGCDRDTPLKSIETAVQQALDISGFSFNNIIKLASIDKKMDEEALLAFAKKHHLCIDFYSAGQLCKVEVPNPSEVVRKYVGTPAVAEAAALLSAQTTQQDLIIEKHKFKGEDKRNATVSIARYKHSYKQLKF